MDKREMDKEDAFYKACELITSITPEEFGKILEKYKCRKKKEEAQKLCYSVFTHK